MSIRVALSHTTSYQFDRLATLSPHTIRLRPAPHCRTPILSYSLTISPPDKYVNWLQDPYGNFFARVIFLKPTEDLVVTVGLIAQLTTINPFDFFVESDATKFPFPYASELLANLQPYLRQEEPGPRLRDAIAGIPRRCTGTVDFLVDINQYVHRLVKYVIRLEPGVQTCEDTLRLGSGSCRDSALLLVQLLRHCGLASRFVSGYLIQLKPDVKPLDGPIGTTVDFTDLHAWTEVYVPGAGWIGLDPTSGLLAGEGHLPLAATPEPSDAAPISGFVDECEVKFDVKMSVERVHELPRVTKPYTDDEWQGIQELGEHVDRDLVAANVKLTMGGEPTFVSADDVDGPEWHTDALGKDKRRLAGQLFRRLSDRFAVGPMLHYAQGKWYPGESLPRWSLGCYWRKDGYPIWRNPDLIATDNGGSYGLADAERFIKQLASALEVTSQYVESAYEDSWYYLWKERRLPSNVDPFDSNLANAEDRARLAKVFEQGLAKVIGYALPLQPVYGDANARWKTNPWFLRSERMYLLPGDSPMGLRLPLDSLPWAKTSDLHQNVARDPFATFPPLAKESALRTTNLAPTFQRRKQPVGVASHENDFRSATGDFEPPDNDWGGNGWHEFWNQEYTPTATNIEPPALGESAPSIVRTALCIEPRDGILHIFLPPIPYLENFLELIEAIENTAELLQVRVRLEGYPPPHDPRLQHFKVTPDPGVIEVNTQPVETWKELVQLTTGLYEEAHQCRLRTEKFMLDGRHTGTGGGNHMVLGGPTAPESPFLRRPDLLRSLVTYWNNRPSLSYLFSGLFVGPTSQAPRVDEARHENLYELEIAARQLDNHTHCPAWLVDRIFRHLLVDLTGNTHRSEFCIDKLFSPDSSSGRLGLVEFRAFEMPPHSQMSLVQQLLIRTLVARFWHTPYTQPAVRWGTMLHDRFMLPHFLAQDFKEVLEETAQTGFRLDPQWFVPHLEFRCPLVGQVTYDGVHIELRQAIEPWHVLGEQSAGGATARLVDSSLERLQVKVRGMTGKRFLVTCNQRRVPLHPTGNVGEFVAGVRFRAWQPPECLHPTIGVHAPLVFDLYDTWNERSLGGCTWQVSHPGGRGFDTFPVNSLEAEGRRTTRFSQHGHTQDRFSIPPKEHHREYPMTLDLRRSLEHGSVDSPH